MEKRNDAGNKGPKKGWKTDQRLNKGRMKVLRGKGRKTKAD